MLVCFVFYFSLLLFITSLLGQEGFLIMKCSLGLFLLVCCVTLSLGKLMHMIIVGLVLCGFGDDLSAFYLKQALSIMESDSPLQARLFNATSVRITPGDDVQCSKFVLMRTHVCIFMRKVCG